MPLIPYFTAMTHLNLVDEMFGSTITTKYNQHTNTCYLHTDWNMLNVGDPIVFDVYMWIDPETYKDMWADRWLLRYATQLIKKQWGENIKKFGNIQLLGGIEFNGKEIYEEADAEITKLEEDMIQSYSLPISPMYG